MGQARALGSPRALMDVVSVRSACGPEKVGIVNRVHDETDTKKMRETSVNGARVQLV